MPLRTTRTFDYIALMLFLSSRRRHTRYIGDWSSDVCSSDLLAIGRKAHDLVLVTVVRKAEILRDGLIEDAERMREEYPAFNRDVPTRPDAPRGARKKIGRASCRERV